MCFYCAVSPESIAKGQSCAMNVDRPSGWAVVVCLQVTFERQCHLQLLFNASLVFVVTRCDCEGGHMGVWVCGRGWRSVAYAIVDREKIC